MYESYKCSIYNILDPPGPPGIPEVEEVGNDFVHLSWEKPFDDGGGRITGYIVERREVSWKLFLKKIFCFIMLLLH